MKRFSIQMTMMLVSLIAGCSLFLMSCHQHQREEEEPSASKATVLVKIKNAVEGDAFVRVDALGKTDALRKEKIYAPIAGRIVALKALEGMEVKKGDVLAVLQTKESEAAILGAESMLKSAVTDLQKIEAEHSLTLARSTQSSMNIRATFDGIISARAVSEGELVAENAELLTVLDLSTIDFLADVPLQDVPAIHSGQRAIVEFQTMPGKEFTAMVDAMNPQTDIQSQSVKVRLQFLGPPQMLQTTLRTDMVGKVHITTGVHHRALFIPKSALLRNDETNSYSLVAMTADSLAKIIPVTVGVMTDSTVEVRSSELRAGMTIVTEGNYSLSDSVRLAVAP